MPSLGRLLVKVKVKIKVLRLFQCILRFACQYPHRVYIMT